MTQSGNSLAINDDERGTSAVGALVNAIREGLRAGQYAPGQRLIENDFIQTYGFSRSTVREALRRLEADGLVEHRHQKGVIVRQFTRHEALALYDVREALEGMAARLAAAGIDEGGNRQKLVDLDKKMDAVERRDGPEGYMRCNEEFHNLIVELGGNPHLPGLIDQLQMTILRLQVRMSMDRKVAGRAKEDHKRITGAILAGNPDAAEKAMRRHVRRSRDGVTGLSETYFADAPPRGAAR